MGRRHLVYVLSPPFFLLEWVKTKLFGKQSMMMINYLIETGEELSNRDLAEIEKAIKNARKAKK